MTQRDMDELRAAGRALRRAAQFAERAPRKFERLHLMLEYSLEEIKFSKQVLESLFERLEE